jgi:hypothetical protein
MDRVRGDLVNVAPAEQAGVVVVRDALVYKDRCCQPLDGVGALLDA